MALPWTHFSPASITSHFDEFDHHRHLGDVGLGGDEVEEGGHRLDGVEQPLVHVDVDDLGAVLDLIEGDREGRGIVAGGDQLAEAGRAGDVGPLADVDEGDLRGEREGFEAREPHQRLHVRHLPRRVLRHHPGDRADMVGRRAATAADHVDEALAGEFLDLRRHELRAFVVLAEGVGQAGVGIGAGEGVGNAGDLRQMRPHRVGPERAVESDGEGTGVTHRVPEGGWRLAGERAAGKIGNGARDHQRQANALLREDLLAGKDRRLGVQGVEDRLDQDQVRPAVNQAPQLLAVRQAQVVEANRAVAGVVHVRRHRGGAVRRPERSRHETPPPVRGLGALGGAADQTRAVAVQFVDHRAHAVVGLRDGSGGEGVGLQNVRTCHGVGVVDPLDGIGLGEDQKVIVTLLVTVADAETVAAELLLMEVEPLDLRPHGAVKDQDPLARGRLQRRERPRLAVGGTGLESHARTPSLDTVYRRATIPGNGREWKARGRPGVLRPQSSERADPPVPR